MTRIEARVRYTAWQVNWWLEGGRHRFDKKGWYRWLSDHYLGMVMRKVWLPDRSNYYVVWTKDVFVWLLLPLRKLLMKLIGQYSHRSDFTDKEAGLLHGGKGWSKEAFDKFIENIS